MSRGYKTAKARRTYKESRKSDIWIE